MSTMRFKSNQGDISASTEVICFLLALLADYLQPYF